MKAYLYWYKSDDYAPTEYIYIIAKSIRQANYIFYSKGYKNMADYSNMPIDVIDACYFRATHHIGDILGQYAVL